MQKYAMLKVGTSVIYTGGAILCTALISHAIRPSKAVDAAAVLGGGMIAIGLGMIVTALFS